MNSFSFNNMIGNAATEGTVNNVLLTENQIGALGTRPRSDITEGLGKSPGAIFDLYCHHYQHFLIDCQAGLIREEQKP